MGSLFPTDHLALCWLRGRNGSYRERQRQTQNRSSDSVLPALGRFALGHARERRARRPEHPAVSEGYSRAAASASEEEKLCLRQAWRLK